MHTEMLKGWGILVSTIYFEMHLKNEDSLIEGEVHEYICIDNVTRGM